MYVSTSKFRPIALTFDDQNISYKYDRREYYVKILQHVDFFQTFHGSQYTYTIKRKYPNSISQHSKTRV